MTAAIEVKDLSFTHRGQRDRTIQQLDFQIEHGEIFGFLGPSGAGKSTTQKILIGILKKYEGSARVLGQEGRDPMLAVGILGPLAILMFIRYGFPIVDIFVKEIFSLNLSDYSRFMFALFLVGFASNKVEGLALSMVGGIFLSGPIFVYFIPGVWSWTGSILPMF